MVAKNPQYIPVMYALCARCACCACAVPALCTNALRGGNLGVFEIIWVQMDFEGNLVQS